jgi:hypothetical protein
MEDNNASMNDSLDENSGISITSSCSNSSDNKSIYTTRTTVDQWDSITDCRKRTNELIVSGDVIQYYDPIYVSGDKRGPHKATVLAVDPKNTMALVLSHSNGIPKRIKLRCIKVIRNNKLLHHSNGVWMSMDQFKLRKMGNAAFGDIIANEGERMIGIMKKQIKRGMDKCKADGFVLQDIIVDNLHSSKCDNCIDLEKDLNVSQDNMIDECSIKVPTPKTLIIPHKSVAESLNILRDYGTIKDVLEMAVVDIMLSCFSYKS